MTKSTTLIETAMLIHVTLKVQLWYGLQHTIDLFSTFLIMSTFHISQMPTVSLLLHN